MRLQRPAWLSDWAGYGNSRLRDGNRSLTWEEFDAESHRVAENIVIRFPERSHIGLMAKNSLDYLITLFAIIRSGNIAVPFNNRLSAAELSALTQFSEVRDVWTDLEIAQQKTQPRAIVEMVPRSEFGEDDTAVLICTSGSDGRPKAVPLGMQTLVNHARAVISHLTVTARDAWLVCLPLFHIGGLAIPFRCLAAGASVMICDNAEGEEINRWIDETGVTFVSVVPTMLQRMLAQREGRPFPDSLRGIIVGGGPVPFELVRSCHLALPTYGMTEAGSMLTCAVPGCGEAERRSAGSNLPETQIRIVDEQGNDLPQGQIGQIIARGPGAASGYWDSTIKTAHTFRAGWIWTGDVGRKDEHGYLHVLARRTDIIISGGENIYPAEIEHLLRQHKDVQQVAVVPVEDHEWGQIPAAAVVGKKGALLSEKKLMTFLETKIARFKQPRKYIFVPSLPMLPTGKPDLMKIKELFT